MADSIMMQLCMAGGAVNLSFNEVLYSQTETSTLYTSTINSYNWKCLMIYHLMCISPFIIFRDAYDAQFSNINSTDMISGITPDGRYIQLIRFYDTINAHWVNNIALTMLLA